ncbi:MAG: sulfatase-like hydrolase/transferase [Pseudomonadales bacterium]|nr:sulfatase-like hydrolase/transferase [Pseudomonadales bacterium]MCP5330096.1 sulfatase-like hydrolase/transferase [Pseudomonadales bacterium]MCP5342994.1 sulfatase-like hydrolase/transferase [Pseudomonadales bacterium]
MNQSCTALRTAFVTYCAVFLAGLVMAWQWPLQFSTGLFLLLALIVQSFVLSSPVLLLYALYRFVQRRGMAGGHVIVVLMQLLCVASIVFMFANYKLHDMYGFYVNFFVVNLLVTPGGVEAMGVTDSTMWTLAVAVFVLGLMVFAALRYIPFEKLYPARLGKKLLWSGVTVLLLFQAFWYAYAEYRYDRGILGAAGRIVWYIPVTARTFFEDLGVPIERPDTAEFDVAQGSGTLDYPATPDVSFTKPYNVVWLVSESLRADMLDPEIMPNTWTFAQKTQRFTQHYSGGNGTRMGMFSQFYGLYGSYWFDFLYAHRPPMLVDLLKKNDYSMMAYTSSRFSYPEFDKTVFASLSDDQLQSYTEGDGWERDRKNVGDMLQYIGNAQKPFFAFMFFESAHANYYFPEESVIREDYLTDFNYLTVDVEENIERIRSRYINATHHLDSQLGRVFDTLEEQGLLDSTIVVVTGDHGEEFMEKGRWGHNSTFSQEQIRVPMLVHIPGRAPGVTNVMTSHLDMPATILAALGADVDPEIYSYGHDLFAPDYARDYTVVSDWHGNTLVTPDLKMVFSKKSAAYDDSVTTLNDAPLDLNQTSSDYRTPLGKFAREVSRFYH